MINSQKEIARSENVHLNLIDIIKLHVSIITAVRKDFFPIPLLAECIVKHFYFANMINKSSILLTCIISYYK